MVQAQLISLIGEEMRNSRAFRRIIYLLLLATVIASQTAIFWYFWDHYYSSGMMQEFFRKGHMVLLFVYALMFTIFSNVYGAFKLGSSPVFKSGVLPAACIAVYKLHYLLTDFITFNENGKSCTNYRNVF